MKYFWIVFVTGKCSLLVVLLRQRKLNLQEKFMRALLPFKESQWMTRNSLHLGTSHNGRMVSQQHNAGPRSLAHTLPMCPLFFNHIASLSPLTLFQYLKCGLVHRTLRFIVQCSIQKNPGGFVMPCKVIRMTEGISFSTFMEREIRCINWYEMIRASLMVTSDVFVIIKESV